MAQTTNLYRFKVPAPDPRPVEWPLPDGTCYWIVDTEPVDDLFNILAYLHGKDELELFWPDAKDVEEHANEPVVFNARFTQPDHYVEER